jgi:hypothetical protein
MITSALRTSRNLLAVGNVEKNYEVRIIEWAKICEYHDKKRVQIVMPNHFLLNCVEKIFIRDIREIKNELILQTYEN